MRKKARRVRICLIGGKGLLFCVALHFSSAQTMAEIWADSLLDRLSSRAQLAQLLLVDAQQLDSSSKYLRRYGLGGLLHPRRTQSQVVPLWRVDSLRIFSTQSRSVCVEEQLLFATTDTLLIQEQGRWRAYSYLQSGINLLYTGHQPCVRTEVQAEAFRHYVKGVREAGLYCVKGQFPTVEKIQLNSELPLAGSESYDNAFATLRRRQRRNFSRKELRSACRRVLLKKYAHVVADNILRSKIPAVNWQRWQRLQAALTLLRNEREILPLQGLDTLQLASLSIVTSSESLPFRKRLQSYLEMSQYTVNPNDISPTMQALTPYTYLIVSLHPSSEASFSKEQLSLIDSLQWKKNVIWVYFGEESRLSNFPRLSSVPVLLLARENSPTAQELAAQALFGGISIGGRLTSSVSFFSEGEGLQTYSNGSLSFVPPEALDIDSKKLYTRLSNIVEEALETAAFPGCQLLLVKDGRVFFNESYGYHSYSRQVPVTEESIYDLASITKVMGPTTALMRLYDEGIFLPNACLSDYMTKFRRTDKGKLDFRSMLAHHSGLQSWIPYYREVFKKNGKPKHLFLSKRPSRRYPTAIGSNLYLRRNFKKRIYKQIAKSELSQRGYKYSGLLFYLLPEIIESLSGEKYVEYLRSYFYAPLGASTLTFLPLSRFSRRRIAPTEEDNFFRMKLLQGVVHDEGAAMMGGISGNAGLFGKAVDVAKMWQMYLQGGYYGGRRYLKSSAVKEFTACQFCEEGNRRGMGFDRPPIHYEENKSSVAPQASQESFGHTGFTGPIVWADDRYGLLFVFLCNRVHPSRDNREIYLRNIRPRIHEAVYEMLCISVSLE